MTHTVAAVLLASCPAVPDIAASPSHSSDAEWLDVLIVGAGLSGIGAAHHLQRRCPDKRYLIAEARAAIGGTWDLFRYPGVRSDSDMYTLGYRFRPWTGSQAIADGPAILRYVGDTAAEAGIVPNIRFGHAVRRAEWSSAAACWTVHGERLADGASVQWRARFLHVCAGYYSYGEAHRPEFAGEAEFAGPIASPQFWPEGLDVAGLRVVVIGSGATAVTLVPALAATAAHVTMLQRSPSYVVARPRHDRIAQRLRKILPARAAYAATRWKNVLVGAYYYRLARKYPERAKARIVAMAAQQLGRGCDAEAHFTPRYKPWDQRVCLVPDGDLFGAIRAGRASVVTDTIERFTRDGIRRASGATLAADVIVVATGLKLNLLGDIALTIDGRPCHPAEQMVYKGMMLSDVPNLALCFGYVNASWTLKADLTADYVCRLLRRMDRRGAAIVMARRDPSVASQPFLSFTSGYVQRAGAVLPKQGTRRPWRVHQNYVSDLLAIRFGAIEDGVLRFGRAGALP
jgi:monooxygenase